MCSSMSVGTISSTITIGGFPHFFGCYTWINEKLLMAGWKKNAQLRLVRVHYSQNPHPNKQKHKITKSFLKLLQNTTTAQNNTVCTK